MGLPERSIPFPGEREPEAVRSGDLDRFALECAQACHHALGPELNAERIKPVLRLFISHLAKFAEDEVPYHAHDPYERGQRDAAISIRDRLLAEANARRSNTDLHRKTHRQS